MEWNSFKMKCVQTESIFYINTKTCLDANSGKKNKYLLSQFIRPELFFNCADVTLLFYNFLQNNTFIWIWKNLENNSKSWKLLF